MNKKFSEQVEELIGEGSKERKAVEEALDALNKAGIAMEYALTADGVSEKGTDKFDKDMMKIKTNINTGKYV